MDSDTSAAIAAGSQRHPVPAGATYSYGTAGFRMHAAALDPVLYRLGLLAALRSKALAGGACGRDRPLRDTGRCFRSRFRSLVLMANN